MASFVGFVDLDDTLRAPVLVRDNQLQPVAADDTPRFRIYGSLDGEMSYMGVSGIAMPLDVTGLYSYAAPINDSDGFVAGNTYFVLISGSVDGIPFASLQVFIVN